MKNKILKWICLIMAVIMTLSLAGCGEETTDQTKKKKRSDSVKEPHSQTSSEDLSDQTDDSNEDLSDDNNSFYYYSDDTDGTDDESSPIQTQERETVKYEWTVNGSPRVYLTDAANGIKFRRMADSQYSVYNVSKLNKKTGSVIYIDPNKTYQEIDGFGASFTDTTSYNLMLLPKEQRDALLVKLFDPNKGIGLSLLRQPTGVSDYNLEYYTYDDMPYGENDYELKNFSIDRDKQRIIPLIKQAMTINPEIKVFAATWSPPVWMKTINAWNSYNNNELRLECYEAYANYLVKFIQAYENEGIPIWSISPQNETTGVHGIPACYYSHQNMARFVNNFLRPALDEANLKTQIWVWDFSMNGTDPMNFATSTISSIQAVAYHGYTNEIGGYIKELKDYFPDLKVHMTELQGQIQSSSDQIFRQFNALTEGMRNGVSSWSLFNILLDQDEGPSDSRLKTHGTALFKLDNTTNEVVCQGDFYAMAHFSKFVRPGAHYIESTDSSVGNEGLYSNVAFLNQNGTVTAILGNQDVEPHTFKMVIGQKVIEYTVPPASIATVTWDANVYQ